jgi:hypothetical protein
MTRPSKKTEDEHLFSRHLILILALLVALIVSELLIFIFIHNDANTSNKDYWAMTLSAFGAWIGAGAAYFFGRENLKTATDSMLKVRGISPEDKLESTSLSDLKPRVIEGKYKEDATVWQVYTWLEDDPDRYFVILLDEKDMLKNVLHEEGLMRYLLDRTKQGMKNDENALKVPKFKEVFKYIEDKVSEMKQKDKVNTANAFMGLANCAVVLKETDSVKLARDEMERRHLLITVVVDSKNKPVGYITSTDIEKLMLSD